VWGEDPTKLKPERWAQLSDVQKTEPGWGHVSTFGYGSKSCIGQRCARLCSFPRIAAVLTGGPLSALRRSSKHRIQCGSLKITN
jgi:cytochrome P450